MRRFVLLLLILWPASAWAVTPSVPPNYCDGTTGHVITKTSTGTGNWNTSGTWTPSGVPSSTDIVVIDNAHVVTVDTTGLAAKYVCVKGTLTWKVDASTALTVHTLQLWPADTDATVQVGKVGALINAGVTARLLWLCDSIDTTFDPEQFGCGLIAFNGFVYGGGQYVTPYLRLNADVAASATSFTLTGTPTNWQTNDVVVFPDTDANENVCQVAPKLEARTLTGDMSTATGGVAALTYAHGGVADSTGTTRYRGHVVNLTRNVAFATDGLSAVRGHMIISMNHVAMLHDGAQSDIRSVQFSNMGRTLASVPVDDTTFSGSTVTHVGTNEKGRYPDHLHHAWGLGDGDGDITFSATEYNHVRYDNVYWASPKAGLVYHDTHFSLLRENITFLTEGAGIVGEDGNEFQNQIDYNFMLQTPGYNCQWAVPRNDDYNDLFYEGSGYWARSMNNHITHNVVANAYLYCYTFFGRNEITPNLKPTAVREWPTVSFDPHKQPILDFDQNECYAATSGLTIWDLGANTDGPLADADITESFVDNFVVWNVGRHASFSYPTNKVTYRDNVFLRDFNDGYYLTGGTIGYFWGDYKSRNAKIDGSEVQGYSVGFANPSIPDNFQDGISPNQTGMSTVIVRDSTWANATDADWKLMSTVCNCADLFPEYFIEWTNNTHLSTATIMPGLNVYPTEPSAPYPYAGRYRRYIWADYVEESGQHTTLIQTHRFTVADFNGDANDDFRVVFAAQNTDYVMPVTGTFNGSCCSIGQPASPGNYNNGQAWSNLMIAVANEVVVTADLPERAGIQGFLVGETPEPNPITGLLPWIRRRR